MDATVLVKGAKQKEVRFFENKTVAVLSDERSGKVTGVETQGGDRIEAEFVVKRGCGPGSWRSLVARQYS